MRSTPWMNWGKVVPSKRHRLVFRPTLELLESRLTPSSLTVGPNVNLSKVRGSQNEASIVINPTNLNNLVGFSNDDAASGGIRIYVSVDAGLTWSTRIFGFHSDGENDACCDTQAAFDKFGNLFVTNLENAGPVKVLLSKDGGQTFQNIATFAGSGDQPSIATGANQVWISFTNGSGSITAAGAPVTGLGNVGAFIQEVAPNSSGGDFGNVAIGSKGQVMVTYMTPTGGAGPATIWGNLDDDGIGPESMGHRFKITGTVVGGFDPIPAQPHRTVDAEPNVYYDRSGGIHNGRVYLVYTDAARLGSKALNIFVRYSDNHGKTWTTPVKVNDDTTTNSHFLPQMAVDQGTGNLAIAWYDARNAGPRDNTAQIFATVSTDGGNTFLPNVQVSAGVSNASGAHDPQDFGDFYTMEFRDNVFYPIWADNSNSTGDNPDGTLHGEDIYTARVIFTSATPPNMSLLFARNSMDLLIPARATFDDGAGTSGFGVRASLETHATILAVNDAIFARHDFTRGTASYRLGRVASSNSRSEAVSLDALFMDVGSRIAFPPIGQNDFWA